MNLRSAIVVAVLVRTASADAPVIGGIMQLDGRFFPDPDPAQVDQFYFKTLRVDLHGTALDHFDVRMLPDFAGGKLVVQDAYVDVRYGDAAKLRFGKTKTPFGIERLQNEIATTFAERALPTQLVPNRDIGAMLFGDLADAAVQYQLGIFNGVADGGSSDGDLTSSKEAAARVFVRPWLHCDTVVGQLGFGAAATYGDKTAALAQPDTPAWKTQGGSTIFQFRTGTSLADTVVADGRHWRGTGQATWYLGPLGVMTEYVRSVQHVALNGTHERFVADAWQVVGQLVVTGDAASYASVTPRHPFDPARGHYGAFDVTARAGEIRVTDGAVFDAGFADPAKSARRAWSAGIGGDWFATKVFRVVVNLERTWFRLGAPGATDRAPETSIIARVQTVF
jgi:phosphate-selective porin OprO/OprP